MFFRVFSLLKTIDGVLQDFQHLVMIEGVGFDKTGVLIIIPAGDADNGGLMVKSALQLLCEIHPVLPVCGHLVFRLFSGQEGVCSSADSAAGFCTALMENFDWWQEIADFCMLSRAEIFVDQMDLIAEKQDGALFDFQAVRELCKSAAVEKIHRIGQRQGEFFCLGAYDKSNRRGDWKGAGQLMEFLQAFRKNAAGHGFGRDMQEDG